MPMISGLAADEGSRQLEASFRFHLQLRPPQGGQPGRDWKASICVEVEYQCDLYGDVVLAN